MGIEMENDNIKEYYLKNKNKIDLMLEEDYSGFSIRPSLEDLDRPKVWTVNHWLWYFEEESKK